MKTILAVLIAAVFNLTAYSQINQTNRTAEKQNTVNEMRPIAVAYRLYPTENMWTFIKLNTRNGQMRQVQFDVQGDDRFETYLSLLPLVSTENETNDRFSLYPTQNMYNFILIDQIDGKTWQVQWSTKPENRGVVPIN